MKRSKNDGDNSATTVLDHTVNGGRDVHSLSGGLGPYTRPFNLARKPTLREVTTTLTGAHPLQAMTITREIIDGIRKPRDNELDFRNVNATTDDNVVATHTRIGPIFEMKGPVSRHDYPLFDHSNTDTTVRD